MVGPYYLKGPHKTKVGDLVKLEPLDVFSLKQYASGIGFNTAGNKIDQGGFPGPVGTDDAHGHVPKQGEINVEYGLNSTECFG